MQPEVIKQDLIAITLSLMEIQETQQIGDKECTLVLITCGATQAIEMIKRHLIPLAYQSPLMRIMQVESTPAGWDAGASKSPRWIYSRNQCWWGAPL